jgi:two-component system response regulator
VVLIAEDNPTDRALLQYAWAVSKASFAMMFVHDGAEVVAYLNGDGAYADRKQYPLPDILVLDLHMPRVDGFGVLDWIKDEPAMEKMQVFILTGSANPEQMAKARDGGGRLQRKPSDLTSYIAFLAALDGLPPK